MRILRRYRRGDRVLAQSLLAWRRHRVARESAAIVDQALPGL